MLIDIFAGPEREKENISTKLGVKTSTFLGCIDRDLLRLRLLSPGIMTPPDAKDSRVAASPPDDSKAGLADFVYTAFEVESDQGAASGNNF
jgi:hypothetical protein